VLGPGDYLDVTSGALAERLPKAISRGPKQVSDRAKPLHLSVDGMVDRRGVEPLTSAVQTERLVRQ